MDELTGKTPPGPGTIRFRADRGDTQLRLDRVIVRRVHEVSRLSRTGAQQWIASGAVRVDGIIVRRPAAAVREGAEIDITLPSTAALRALPQPEPHDLRILYEDDVIIAVDKPPGVVVHPSYKQASSTLLNGLLWYLRARPDARPGILTRLDKDTSGIMVVALTATVHATLQRDQANRSIDKEYLAIVKGRPRPRAGTIDAPLARDPQDRRRVVVAAGGAASQTRYEVAAEQADLALLRCQLVTGRTHQIRVHLASRGWPVLGDAVYGERDERIARQALHAWRITLSHPLTRDPLTIVAPIPADMRTLGSGFF